MAIDVLNIILTKLQNWGSQAVSILPNLLVAVILIAVFAFIGKKTRKILKRRLHALAMQDSLTTLLSTTIYIVILAIGVFAALGVLQLNKTVTSLLAGAGIIGLALAFAFQDIAANFISGIIMAVKKEVDVGDIIETNGYTGIIQEITLRTTALRTGQGQIVTIPNSSILQNPIVNYSTSGERRIDLGVGVGYEDDLEKAQKIGVEAVQNLSDVDSSRVQLFYNEFGGSSINFVLRFWIEFGQEQKPFFEAQSNAIKAVKKAYEEADINIPYPIRTIDVGDDIIAALQK